MFFQHSVPSALRIVGVLYCAYTCIICVCAIRIEVHIIEQPL